MSNERRYCFILPLLPSNKTEGGHVTTLRVTFQTRPGVVTLPTHHTLTQSQTGETWRDARRAAVLGGAGRGRSGTRQAQRRGGDERCTGADEAARSRHGCAVNGGDGSQTRHMASREAVGWNDMFGAPVAIARVVSRMRRPHRHRIRRYNGLQSEPLDAHDHAQHNELRYGITRSTRFACTYGLAAQRASVPHPAQRAIRITSIRTAPAQRASARHETGITSFQGARFVTSYLDC
jgi:hypothetical protein